MREYPYHPPWVAYRVNGMEGATGQMLPVGFASECWRCGISITNIGYGVTRTFSIVG